MIHVKIILVSSFVTTGSMRNLNDRPPSGKDHKFSPFTTNGLINCAETAGAERRRPSDFPLFKQFNNKGDFVLVVVLGRCLY